MGDGSPGPEMLTPIPAVAVDPSSGPAVNVDKGTPAAGIPDGVPNKPVATKPPDQTATPTETPAIAPDNKSGDSQPAPVDTAIYGVAPVVDAAVAPPIAEDQAKKETQTRRRKEVKLVGDAIVSQAVNEYKRALQQKKDISNNSRLQAARLIFIAKESNAGNFPKAGIEISGNAVILKSPDGQPLTVKKIIRCDGDIITYVTSNSNDPHTASREVFIQALVASDVDNLTEGKPAQREILQTFVDLQGPDGSTMDLGDSLDPTIEAAGISMGFISTSALKLYIEKNITDKATQASLTTALGDSKLATPEIAGAILFACDKTPATLVNLNKTKTAKEQEIALMKNGGYQKESISKAESELAAIEMQIKQYEAYPKSEKDVVALIRKTYSGEINVPNPDKLDTAIRNNQIDKYLDELIDSCTDPAEKERLGMLKKIVAASGVGGLVIVALIVMQAVGGSK